MKDGQKVSAVFLVANDMSLRVCNIVAGYVICQDTDGLTLFFVCELISNRAHGCDTQQRNNRHVAFCCWNSCTFMCSVCSQYCFSEQYEYAEIFKKGWTSANDVKCSVYPSQTITTEKLQEAVAMFLRVGSYCHRTGTKIKYQPRVTIFNSVWQPWVP